MCHSPPPPHTHPKQSKKFFRSLEFKSFHATMPRNSGNCKAQKCWWCQAQESRRAAVVICLDLFSVGRVEVQAGSSSAWSCGWPWAMPISSSLPQFLQAVAKFGWSPWHYILFVEDGKHGGLGLLEARLHSSLEMSVIMRLSHPLLLEVFVLWINYNFINWGASKQCSGGPRTSPTPAYLLLIPVNWAWVSVQGPVGREPCGVSGPGPPQHDYTWDSQGLCGAGNSMHPNCSLFGSLLF